MEPKPNHAHDLATRIYVELVSRNTQLEEGSVKLSASAANMATLSIKLAEAFYQAEAQAIAAKEPAKDYKLGADDIATWMK
jgi:hypothetical protein